MVKVKKWIRKNNFHILCLSITIGFLLCLIFKFSDSTIRIKESFIDIFNSFKYYLKEILNLNIEASPTINEFGSVKFKSRFHIAENFEEFKQKWKLYWQVFISKENIILYFEYLAQKLYYIFQYFMLIGLPLILIIYMLFRKFLNSQNNNYNQDSKPLKIYKKLENKTIIPVKHFINSFIYFLKEHDKYYKFWLFVWAGTFNIITMFVEFLAFYFYFVCDFNFLSIYKQIYKFLCDFSTVTAFFPVFMWFIFGYILVRIISKKIGYKRLNFFESRDSKFINDRPIVTMIVGTMGKRKTTILTDMALSEEVIFRNKAYEKLIENDLKFPNFPWINLENTLKMAMKKHIIYNLATIKKFIDMLEICFYAGFMNKANEKSIRRHLKKVYEIDFNNLIFDYDYNKYGVIYDDKLKIVNIWEVIKTYSQLYFIFIIQSSLIVSNYSVRTDNIFNDIGNFPMWDTDFFKRDSKNIDFISRHAKILDFDALRLGKKMLENNKNKDAFEFGVVLVTEIGKELKNALELRETKKNDDSANQKNDGLLQYLKMCRHSATVDNFPFIKFISDEQRPTSLGADARDLCEIVNIKSVSERKLAMPFFIIEEIIYMFVFDKFLKIYNEYRFNRGDNTLFMYLYKNIVTKIYNFYNGIYNIFGYSKMELQVEDGTLEGEKEDKNYYLMTKKIYSKRFSTDCFNDFFIKKTIKSKIGLEDLQEYKTEKASIEELKEQHSYFIGELVGQQESNEKEE